MPGGSRQAKAPQPLGFRKRASWKRHTPRGTLPLKTEVERKTPMSLTPLSLLAVFGAGLLSFLSPCVVALVPGYLAHLSGSSLQEVKSRHSPRRQVSLQALWPALGWT